MSHPLIHTLLVISLCGALGMLAIGVAGALTLLALMLKCMRDVRNR